MSRGAWASIQAQAWVSAGVRGAGRGAGVMWRSDLAARGRGRTEDRLVVADRGAGQATCGARGRAALSRGRTGCARLCSPRAHATSCEDEGSTGQGRAHGRCPKANGPACAGPPTGCSVQIAPRHFTRMTTSARRLSGSRLPSGVATAGSLSPLASIVMRLAGTPKRISSSRTMRARFSDRPTL